MPMPVEVVGDVVDEIARFCLEHLGEPLTPKMLGTLGAILPGEREESIDLGCDADGSVIRLTLDPFTLPNSFFMLHVVGTGPHEEWTSYLNKRAWEISRGRIGDWAEKAVLVVDSLPISLGSNTWRVAHYHLETASDRLVWFLGGYIRRREAIQLRCAEGISAIDLFGEILEVTTIAGFPGLYNVREIRPGHKRI